MSATTHKQSNSKRLGFGRACNACRKRKHRCDALEPQCSGCRSRGNACEYSVRAATNKGVVQGQEDSLNHGHAIIIDVSPNRSPHPILSPQRSSPLSTSARHTHSASSLQEDRQGSVSLEPASSSLRAGAAIELSNPTGYFGNSSAIKFASVAQNCDKDSLTRDENELYLSEDIATLPESSPREDLQRFQLVLDRFEGNQLVDAYFARVHLLYPFVHEMSFRSHYEQIWIDQQPRDNAWLAILNMVFAYGCEFCPCPNGVSAAQRASEFVEQAKQIILCQVFKASSLHLTQALLLLCHWLQGALELNEAWNFFGLAIRSAMSIGLHINPRDGGISSTISREIRKRIWWGYFVLDRTLSMKFGRPPSIILANAFDVDLPADVDDQYISDSIQVPRQPNGKPSRITAFIQTIGLSRVIDNVMSMLYLKSNKLDASAGTSLPVQEDFQLLGNMLLLDGQLQSWWNGVPDYLTRSLDTSEGKDLTRQRNVLYIRYVQMRLLLLRPSVLLLGKDKFQDRFLRAVATECAQRCVWAAQETIQLIHGKYQEQQLHSVWYLLHYIFSSLGVLIAAQRLGILASWDSSSSHRIPAILDEGMEFLRSASHQSGIAHRYMLLLGRHLGQLNDSLNSNSAVRRPGCDGKDVPESNLPTQVDSLDLGRHPAREQTDFEPGSMSFPDLNDFLFGMGIPQNFLVTDWLSYDWSAV